MHPALEHFHPIVRRWFLDDVGDPTDVQAQAWPLIASGRHVLASAPTGTGKTLTAFLWALDRFLTGAWEPGAMRVLYVSPLKALNNDIQRNLLEPLTALRARFAAEGLTPPDIRVLTRSGDTPQDERQRMVRRPPEILITTPESLHLILSSPRARAMLATVETCILDEVHAVAESKRGSLLMACVERLTLLAGEVQRIALSATVRPADVIAAFIGGYRPEGDPKAPRYVPRPVETVQSDAHKRYDLQVRFPFDPLDIPREESDGSPLLRRLATRFADIAQTNRSTLIFANNRRLSERLSLLINEGQDELLAYSHHGSLSREIRAVVEQRMKAGELRAIVATSSLELGIDIGALDEVILVDAPQTVAAAVQRVGRAGHRVGETSRGTFYPVGGRALVDAAVAARCIREQDIEALRPVTLPLDVLAQLIVSMCCVDAWDVEELCAFVRSIYPFRRLTDTQFALTVGMLAGRYEETRIRALKPLLSVDLTDGVITARPGAARTLYASGGTIPDRGYYTLRRADTNARIGELDEEFVWERRRNDAFSMGMHTWRIKTITHSDVLVEPAKASIANVPFWKAEEPDRSFHLSERIGLFLEQIERALSEKDERLFHRLCADYALDEAASAGLLRHLRLQREAASAPLPHRHHVLVERFCDPNSRDAGAQIALHAVWGGRVNRPLAFALAQAWEDRYGGAMEVLGGNNCILIMTPGRNAPDDVLSLVDRFLRRAVPRERRPRPPVAPGVVQAPHAALAEPAALPQAPRGRVGLPGLPHHGRDVAIVSGRRLRPRHAAVPARRSARRPDRRHQRRHPAPHAVRAGDALARDEHVHV